MHSRVTNEEANPHGVRACLLCPGVGNTPCLTAGLPPPLEQRVKMLQRRISVPVVLACLHAAACQC
jgi:hypothetical protein